MSPKSRHVNATSAQRLPACLQEALRALLARRELDVSGAIFFNIADRLYLFFTQISPTEPTCPRWSRRSQVPPSLTVLARFRFD
jgi:hypothetical protein